MSTMILNPALRPIEEATHEDGPIMVYSADASPMMVQLAGRDPVSMDLGWIGNGEVQGVHTARAGFFPKFQTPDRMFTWTHFAKVEPMTMPEGHRVTDREITEHTAAWDRAMLLAPHCQGGHSRLGADLADVLGITFPLDMFALVDLARSHEMNPAKLYPWLIEQGNVDNGAGGIMNRYFTPEEIRAVPRRRQPETY